MRPGWIIGITATLLLALASLAAGNDSRPYVATCLRSSLPGPGCSGRVEFAPGGAVVPGKLPARGLAPVALGIYGKIAMEAGGHPVALREAIVDIAKDVSIDATGLPACRRGLLERSGVAAARQLCRTAIVGNGVAHIGLASSETVLEAPLTVFNGGTSDGETRLFVHSAIGAPHPVPVVGSVKVQRMDAGLHAIWRIPRILEGDGSLLDFELEIGRRFIGKGKENGYLFAKCPDGVIRVNVPNVLLRNDARVPGVENAVSLKGAFALPCSPTP